MSNERGVRALQSTHIAIDAVDDVPRGQVRDLWVCVHDVVCEDFDERLPLLLRLSEHRLCDEIYQ